MPRSGYEFRRPSGGAFRVCVTMHPSSYQSMKKFREEFVPFGPLVSVLDVGGANVNGSYRDLFPDCDYQTLDFKGADYNVEGYDWPIKDRTFDVVITGQTLEHDPQFWRTLQNIARVLKVDGVACVIVPGAGKIHRYPVDCYRFLPDCAEAWAIWTGLELAKTWQNDEPPWLDLVAIYRKTSKQPSKGLTGA